MAPYAHQESVLDLRLLDVRQLFNSMDPAPFRERDLDPYAVTYIEDWASQIPASQPLALNVQSSSGLSNERSGEVLDAAIHEYFSRRAGETRLELKRLFRTGRISLLIGLTFLAIAIAVGELVATTVRPSYAYLVRESFMIGGWVALWHPLDIFLYRWWPIVGRIKLDDRLSRMTVRLSAP